MPKTKFFLLALLCVCTYIGSASAMALYRERYHYDYDTHHYLHMQHQIAQQRQYAIAEAERQRQFFAAQQAARERAFRLQQEQLRQSQLQQQMMINMSLSQTKVDSKPRERVSQVVQERYAQSEQHETPTLVPVYPVQPQRPMIYAAVDDSPVPAAPKPLPKVEATERNEKSSPNVIHEKQSASQWKVPVVASLITLALLYLGYQYYYEEAPDAVTSN